MREINSQSSATLTAIFAARIRGERRAGGALSGSDTRMSRIIERSHRHAHPDDRAGAVPRAARHGLQRISSYPRPHGSRPHRRSRDVSVRPGSFDARPAGLPVPAAAVSSHDRHRTFVREDPARRVPRGHGVRSCAARPVRRGALARGRDRDRDRARGDAARAASLRHALEPAAAAHELSVHAAAPRPLGVPGTRTLRRVARAW